METHHEIDPERQHHDPTDFDFRPMVPGSNRQLARGTRSGEAGYLFGSFRLLPAQRLLLSGEEPVRLGSRAMDILIVLVERAGELVSKDRLMARVWPCTFVVPSNLTVHLTALRRALRDGIDGNRHFVNVPGRGYYFVAPVVLENHIGGPAV
jgi:DNA-binding winged helix-turn-helix (wHTH) protein